MRLFLSLSRLRPWVTIACALCAAACQPSLHPPAFGAGFLDITPATAPFVVPAFDPNSSPVATYGVAADLTGKGDLRLLLVDVVTPAFNLAYSVSGAALVPDPSFVIGDSNDRPPPISALIDLDGDRLPDALYEQHGGLVSWNAGGVLGSPLPLTQASSPVAGTPGAVAWDLDDDGWLDVLIAGDPCMVNGGGLRVLMAVGPRQFIERSDLVAPAPTAISQALGVGLRPDGTPMIEVLGGGCEQSGGVPLHFARGARGGDGYPRFAPVDLDPGLDFSFFSPMGALEVDLDGDGLLDHVETLDPRHTVLKGKADGSYGDVTDHTDFATLPSSNGAPMIPWGVAALDLDGDGLLDLLFAHGDDFSAFLHDDHGEQRVSAHWNGGALRFADVSSALHLDHAGQYSSLLLTDLDGDGAPDLLVGGWEEPPRIYLNRVGGHWIALRLRGTTSNPLGLGASVTATLPDGTTRRALCGGQIPTGVMGEPLVFFNLGEQSSAQLSVAWPSGVIQAQAASAGQLTEIDEPPVLVIDPPSRQLPADGKSTLTVTVTPPAGGPSGPVTIEVGGQPVPVIAGGASYVATVTAPTTAGSSLLKVTLGTQPLGITPRLFWK